MSHFSGIIATIKFSETTSLLNDYEKDSFGVYCRRRLQLSEEALDQFKLLNFSSFLHHPPIEDPQHSNGLLSILFLLKNLRYFALRIPPEYSRRLAFGEFGLSIYWRHSLNVLKDLPALFFSLPKLFIDRIVRKRKLPSIIIPNPEKEYSLHYHVEHTPRRCNRVTLTKDRDRFGLQKVRVELFPSDYDIDSILEAHKIIADRLLATGAGKLQFLEEDVRKDIRSQIGFGGHQVGTARMADSPEQGVVDENCKVYGVENLFIAGSAVFPTTSHANPVLTIVAMSLRLAKHIGSLAECSTLNRD